MVIKYRRYAMSLVNRLKQLAAAGIALTTFAEASNSTSETLNDTPTATQPRAPMDAKTAAGELYKYFRAEEKKTPRPDENRRAQIAQDFIETNNLSDKDVYDMTLNYAKYVTQYIRETENERVDTKAFSKDIPAVYSAFTQTDFYKTERDRIIRRWMPMAENVSEGYYRYGYKCTAGYPTIGIGTCLTTSGLSLNDIPIRKIQRGDKGEYLYKNGEPIPGEELTLREKKEFVTALSNLNSSSYSSGKVLTEGKGIYGLTLEDARSVAILESKEKMDEILKFAFLNKKVDLFKEPSALGVLALDIHYQCGNLTSSKEWPNFWRCVCNKQYGELHNHVTVNNGQNKARQLVKRALCDHIAADYTTTHGNNPKARNRAWNARNLAYERIRGYGVDIYGLKLRGKGLIYYSPGVGMAKSASAKPTLKKREISEEQRAKFEEVKKIIERDKKEANSKKNDDNTTPIPTVAPNITTSAKKLKELQIRTKALPKDKRAKPMNRQELNRLAKRNNVSSKNLIHLTTNGGVDINVCLDYLKEETQKINRAIMHQNRNQGR